MSAALSSFGPYSRPSALARMDGRTKEARLLRAARAELTAHVGGKPNAVQKALIDRAAMLALRLALMDAQTGPDGGMTERNAREYVCWHNAYVRTLAQLGMRAVAERPPSLAEILASAPARRAAQEAAPV